MRAASLVGTSLALLVAGTLFAQGSTNPTPPSAPTPPRAPTATSAPAAPAAPTAPAAPKIAPPPAPSITLFAGDPAPPLAPETWIKCDAVKDFADGKVYVVEFWATWCGPCIQQIPHLTQVQKDHPEITIIGVAASERAPKTGEDDLRLSKVRDFVSGKGDAMGYCVAYTPNRSIPDAWMAAAGQRGIPCTFLVGKDGVIEWIGHPMGLEEPLEAVLAGTWDRAAAAKKSRAAAAARERQAKLIPLMAEAQKSGNWDPVLAWYDEAIAANPDDDESHIARFKLLAGRAAKPELASKTGRELVKRFDDDPMSLNEIAWFVVDDRSVAKRDLELALAAAERANEIKDSDDAMILDTLARVWWEKGDKAKAIEFQKLAVRTLGNETSPMSTQIKETLEKYESEESTKK